MNTPVKFELAKLLKEKGFDKITTSAYHKNSAELVFTDWNNIESNDDILIPESFNTDKDSWLISAPTIADVVMWLYEKHNIWIYVDSHEFGKWCYNFKFNRPNKLHPHITENGQFGLDDYNSPTEAYEAAIEYTLKNLIK